MPLTSPATRLVELLNQAKATEGNPEVVERWAAIFRVEEKHPHRKAQEVARLLGLLYQEFESVRATLTAMEEGLGGYDKPLQHVDTALSASIRSLAATWQVVRDPLNDNVMSVVRTLPRWLPRTEEAIGAADLDGLREYLLTLEQEIRGAGFPQAVEQFLLRQVAFARRASREYAIRGAAAFESASGEAAIHWVDHLGDLEGYRESPVVQKTWGLWSWIDTWGNRITTMSAMAGLVFTGATWVQGHMHGHALPHSRPIPYEWPLLPGTSPAANSDDDDRRADDDPGAAR